MAILIASLFTEGKAPGRAKQIGHIKEFGVAPYFAGQPQNILVLVDN